MIDSKHMPKSFLSGWTHDNKTRCKKRLSCHQQVHCHLWLNSQIVSKQLLARDHKQNQSVSVSHMSCQGMCLSELSFHFTLSRPWLSVLSSQPYSVSLCPFLHPSAPLWFLWLNNESWKLLKTLLSRFIHQPYPVMCLSFSCPWVSICFSRHLLQCYFSCLNFLSLKLPSLTSFFNLIF